MCLEDLRLGRGRHIRSINTYTSGQNSILNPDASRVAILFSLSADEYYDPAGGLYINTKIIVYSNTVVSLALSGAATIGPKSTSLILRVEDFGNLVTGPWSFLQLTTGGQWFFTVTDVYTEVNAPPLDTYKP